MNIKILDGKSLAKATEESIAKQVNDLNTKGITPTLATILVGQDPASETYVKMKRNTCARVGMKSIAVEMSDSTTTEELLIKINELGNKPEQAAKLAMVLIDDVVDDAYAEGMGDDNIIKMLKGD